MALTMNQQETLHAIVKGTVSGMLLKPIPKLVEKGLVVVEQVPNRMPFTRGFAYQPTTITRYRLTPEGVDTYITLRVKWRESALKTLQDEFGRDTQAARNLVTLRGSNG